MNWMIAFWIMLGVEVASSVFSWLGTRKLKRMIRDTLAARREDARVLIEILDTQRPFLEDIIRLDPAMEEPAQIGLLELDAALDQLHKITEDNSFARRYFGEAV